jgi:hypothetical protein
MTMIKKISGSRRYFFAALIMKKAAARNDRSRRPYRNANQLPFQIETRIVRLKQDKPSWGAPRISERLARLYPDVHTPAISTVHAVLDRHGQDIVVTSLDGSPAAPARLCSTTARPSPTAYCRGSIPKVRASI